jgi:hypothetical protein
VLGDEDGAMCSSQAVILRLSVQVNGIRSGVKVLDINFIYTRSIKTIKVYISMKGNFNMIVQLIGPFPAIQLFLQKPLTLSAWPLIRSAIISNYKLVALLVVFPSRDDISF